MAGYPAACCLPRLISLVSLPSEPVSSRGPGGGRMGRGGGWPKSLCAMDSQYFILQWLLPQPGQTATPRCLSLRACCLQSLFFPINDRAGVYFEHKGLKQGISFPSPSRARRTDFDQGLQAGRNSPAEWVKQVCGRLCHGQKAGDRDTGLQQMAVAHAVLWAFWVACTLLSSAHEVRDLTWSSIKAAAEKLSLLP